MKLSIEVIEGNGAWRQWLHIGTGLRHRYDPEADEADTETRKVLGGRHKA
jgi:hypothetical protein